MFFNKGTGAGGKKCTINGLDFEKSTNIYNYLIQKNFTKNILSKNKYGFYLYNKINDIEIIWTLQGGLKEYFNKNYNIKLLRTPDEAYIIKDSKKDYIILKIIEKKSQNVEGSVETKLLACPSLKREYEILLSSNNKYKFIIDYALSVNDFFSIKFNSLEIKYKIMKQILDENKINIFYGSNINYYHDIYQWLFNYI